MCDVLEMKETTWRYIHVEAQTVAEALLDQLFCKFGVPDIIHSAQDRQIDSRPFKDSCDLLGIRKLESNYDKAARS